MTDMTEPLPEVAAAIADADAAFKRAERAVAAIEDPEEAFHQAKLFAAGLRGVYDQDATLLVARMALLLTRAREWSAGELAERTGESRQRFWRRTKRAEAAEQEGTRS